MSKDLWVGSTGHVQKTSNTLSSFLRACCKWGNCGRGSYAHSALQGMDNPEAFSQRVPGSVTGALGRSCCSWVEPGLDEETPGGRKTTNHCSCLREIRQQWMCKDSGLDPLQLGYKSAACLDLKMSIIQRGHPAPWEKLLDVYPYVSSPDCVALWVATPHFDKGYKGCSLEKRPQGSLWVSGRLFFLLFPLAFPDWLTKTPGTRKWNLESIFSFNFF